MNEYNKPLPHITEISKKFWQATKKHKLLIQRCPDCGKNVFYPKRYCPNCLSDRLEWIETKGRGKVYSFSVCLSNAAPGFENDVPYTVAVVDLEEGVRVLTHIIDCKQEDLKCDMEVEVVFDDVTEEITLPKFKPV